VSPTQYTAQYGQVHVLTYSLTRLSTCLLADVGVVCGRSACRSPSAVAASRSRTTPATSASEWRRGHLLDDGLCQSPFDVLRGGPWKIGLWRRHVLGGHHSVSAGVLDVLCGGPWKIGLWRRHVLGGHHSVSAGVLDVLRGGPWRRHVMGGHYAVPVLVDRLWGGPW